ncbi:hypothetical protein D3C77_567580 [compost metagenome]
MPETDVLQGGISVEVLLPFFQINIEFVLIGFTCIAHILLYIEVDAADGIHELDKPLEIGIDVILNRYAKQFGYRLHRSVRPVGDRRIDPVGAVFRYF